MAGAGTVYVDVRADTSGFLADIRKAGDSAQTAVGKIAGAAALAATGVGALGIAAVKSSTEFNKALSGVAAVSGATAQQLDQLRQAALDAGAATVFSASQAATAEAELAKAGLSTSDILGGALRGSLDLAAAGQLDLANAATITAQALNTFGLNGDQTSRVADVLAAGANKSAADVGQLGQALQQSGLVAKQTGLTLEDTVGVLSLFAQNGLQASDAGTSLRTMLLRLNPTSKEASELMAQLGLNFYDARGQFVGIEGVADQLAKKLGGLSVEQRNAALSTIFGSDAIRGATLLYESGAQGVRDYVAAVNDQGAAQRVAAKQLDNLAGDIEQFKGSVETALIGLGDTADEGLRSFVQSATGFVNRLGEVASSPALGAIVSGVESVAAQIVGAFDGVGDDIIGFFEDLDPKAVESFFSGIGDAIDGLEGPLAGLAASFGLLAATKLPFIGGALSGILPAITPVQGALAGLVLQSDDARDALGEIFSVATDAAEAFAPVLSAVADALGFVADQGDLVTVALDAFVAYKLVNVVSPWIASVRGLGESFIYLGQQIGQIAATQGVSRLTALRGVLSSTASEAGGLSGALGGVSLATAGVTTAVAGGLYLYQNWAEDIARVKDETKALTQSLLDQVDSNAVTLLAQQFQEILNTRGDEEDGFAAAFRKTGLAISEVTKIVNDAPGDFDRFRQVWNDVGQNADVFTEKVGGVAVAMDAVPKSVRPLVENLFRLNQAGTLTDQELRQVINAITDLDQEAAGSARGITAQAQALKEEADAARINIRSNDDFKTALSDNSSIEERRRALQRLIEAYPDLAAAAGIASDAAGETGDSAKDLGGIMGWLAGRFQATAFDAKGVASAILSIGGASRESLGDILGLQDAQSQLVAANDRVADARKKVADIESGNTEGIISARKSLVEADRSLTRALQDQAKDLQQARDDVLEAQRDLDQALAKGAAQAQGGKAFGQGEADMSVALDIARATERLADAQQKVRDLESKPTEQVTSAQERKAEAQARYNDELKKAGPASDAYRASVQDLEAAQRDQVDAALAVSDAQGKVTAEDIPAAIGALQQLESQHLLTKDAVDGVVTSLLQEAAALQAVAGGSSVPVKPPAAAPAAPTSAARPASPGFRNADREGGTVGAAAASGGGLFSNLVRPLTNPGAGIAEGVLDIFRATAQRDLGGFLRLFPTAPAYAEGFSVGGQNFVWNGSTWVGGDKQKAFETWQARGYATGGLVGGSGTGDTVRALLTPKEYVSTVDTVAREGVGAFDALNRGDATITPRGDDELGGKLDALLAELQSLRQPLVAAVNARPNVTGNTVNVVEATPERTYLEVQRSLADATYGRG